MSRTARTRRGARHGHLEALAAAVDVPEEPCFPPKHQQRQQEVLILPSTADGTRELEEFCGTMWLFSAWEAAGGMNACSPLQQRLRKPPNDSARLGQAPTLDAAFPIQPPQSHLQWPEAMEKIPCRSLLLLATALLLCMNTAGARRSHDQ